MAFAATVGCGWLAAAILTSQPAAADPADAVTNCATGAIGPDGALDGDQLKACLGRVHDQFVEPAVPELPAPEPAAAPEEPALAAPVSAPASHRVQAPPSAPAPLPETFLAGEAARIAEAVTAARTAEELLAVELASPTVASDAEPPTEEAAPAAAPAAAAPDDGLSGAFAALRQCESGGDYGINTGNGYYGAYQFLPETWWGLGYSGYPHEAPPAVQDQAARELQALYGWGQWPACSRQLGLR